MDTYEIPSVLYEAAKEEPESGIGYQVVSIAFRSQVRESGILFCRSYFVPYERNGELLRAATNTPPEIDYFYLEEPRIILSEEKKLVGFTPSLEVTSISPLVNQPLVKHASSISQLPPFFQRATGSEVFFRVSPYRKDRNIMPDGSVVPRCYCTSDNDMTVVPSGLAAVGRYALPSRLPAIHVFRIQPPKGTPYLCGTVTPNFGLAGGGVEAYFPLGCPAGSAVFDKKLPMK
jgi:hypothetical protein